MINLKKLFDQLINYRMKYLGLDINIFFLFKNNHKNPSVSFNIVFGFLYFLECFNKDDRHLSSDSSHVDVVLFVKFVINYSIVCG